jgi:hypothetical protein
MNCDNCYKTFTEIVMYVLLFTVTLAAIWATIDWVNLYRKLLKSKNGDKEAIQAVLSEKSTLFSKPILLNALKRKTEMPDPLEYWEPINSK